MVSKAAFNLMLIVSIVFQSFTAIASPADNHQIDIEHIQTEHDHAIDSELSNIENGSDEHNIDDCHHCGHCSSSHITWVAATSLLSTSAIAPTYPFSYRQSIAKAFLEDTLRPPIS